MRNQSKQQEIEEYYIDVVAVDQAISSETEFQIYSINMDKMRITPLSDEVYESREKASEFLMEIEYLQISIEMLKEELRRIVNYLRDIDE